MRAAAARLVLVALAAALFLAAVLGARAGRLAGWRQRVSVMPLDASALPCWRSSSSCCCRREPRRPRAAATTLAVAARLVGRGLDRAAVFCWRQPFRAGAVPDQLAASPRRAAVASCWCMASSATAACGTPGCKRLRAAGVPYVAVNLEPVFGGIDGYVATASTTPWPRARRRTGLPPVIVGHSMGGLAVRAWLRAKRHAGETACTVIITIGTPHRGTWLGALLACTRNARQMRLGSAWLRRPELHAETASQRASRFTCFYSHCDNIVFPASTATLAGRRQPAPAPASAHVHDGLRAAGVRRGAATRGWIATQRAMRFAG